MKYLVEYLPRIHCIGAYVDSVRDLRIEEIKDSELIVSFTKNALSERCITKIMLPIEIDRTLNTNVSFIKGKGDNFSLRLKVHDATKNKDKSISYDGNNFDLNQDNIMHKWNRLQLLHLKSFVFRCLKCEAPIIDKERNCDEVHDMPSEYWTELMDYWHCHKPALNHNANANSKVQDFSMKYNNSLVPLKNEILVGGSFFTVIPETILDRVKLNEQKVLCLTCEGTLGEVTKDGLCKIFKWNVTFFNRGDGTTDVYQPENEVILSLLNYNTGYSGRYVRLKCPNHSSIMIWIFSINIGVSLSNNSVLRRAIKLLYTCDAKKFAILKKTHNVEEVSVNESPFEHFVRQLVANHDALPQCASKFNFWEISYLPLI